MNRDLEVILEFVEGKIDPTKFEAYFYQSPTIEALFEHEEDRIYKNVYYRLLACDYKSSGGVLNAHGYLCDWLDKQDISYLPTQQYSTLYNLILSAQPTWLDVDPSYIQINFLQKHPKAKRAEIRKWLLEQFKYVTSPPKWLQNPEWPIQENIPLLFVAQLSRFTTNIYIFFNPETYQCEVIEQSD